MLEGTTSKAESSSDLLNIRGPDSLFIVKKQPSFVPNTKPNFVLPGENSVISRVKDFLPKIHKSNTLINNALCGADAEEAAKRLDIEHLDSNLDRLIEMDVTLIPRHDSSSDDSSSEDSECESPSESERVYQLGKVKDVLSNLSDIEDDIIVATQDMPKSNGPPKIEMIDDACCD